MTKSLDALGIGADELEYVYHATFSLPATENRLWGPDRETITVKRYSILPATSTDTTTAAKRRNKPLTGKQEKTLFMRYNYAKFRMCQVVRDVEAGKPLTQNRKREIRKWRRRARRTREKIVHANLPLVPTMARRKQIKGVDFTELVSEGYMAVLRAVEKFDASRGYKFSTYACRAILSGFYRLGRSTQRRRKYIPVYFDPEMEKSDYDDIYHEDQARYAQETVEEVLRRGSAELSPVEEQVIFHRFAFDGKDQCKGRKRGKTLGQVGKIMGLSNERVRQIEKASLIKIREALEDQLLV
jgi:RNA polymerase primary sigma factor